ncbi:DUF418 domain-containing protein [Saliterribacillus persicus]|uniref:DUF418 domain-containing protein n=1 Tax=Saliterribacillus persicus TaxID=930114 RepID=UPI0011C072BD|nr:DUF418 domain-containing protein [Saliterribacillus persicus]
MFGIFLGNMQLFQTPQLVHDMYMIPQQMGESDKWIRIFLDIFVEFKFFSIFSFLFGLGFYIFMSRAEKKIDQFYTLFLRRLTILAIFGFLHLVFLWYGDVLLNYALAGFFLIFFYKRKTKTIFTWILIFTIALTFLLLSNLFSSAEELTHEIQMLQVDGSGKVELAIEHYHNGSYLDWLTYRFNNEVIPILKDLPFSILTALYMFLLGLYIGKRRIISEFDSHKDLVKRTWWISLLFSIPFSIFILIFHLDILNYGVLNEIAIQVFITLSGLSLSLFYISSLIILLQKDKWIKFFHPLSYVGRMALTNYLIQSIIGVGIFKGLGLFGELNLGLGIVISLIVFPIQILLSYLWLKNYKYGPLEWVWRSATYGKIQPLKYRD